MENVVNGIMDGIDFPINISAYILDDNNKEIYLNDCRNHNSNNACIEYQVSFSNPFLSIDTNEILDNGDIITHEDGYIELQDDGSQKVKVNVSGVPQYGYETDCNIFIESSSAKFESGSFYYAQTYHLNTEIKKYWYVKIKADNLTKIQGQADPALSCHISLEPNSPASYDGSTPCFTGSLTREPGEAVGTYPIIQGNLALANNGKFKADWHYINFVGSNLVIITAPPNSDKPTPSKS